MTSAPEKSPAAPMPATDRPTINIVDDTEAPHIKLPSSNMAKKQRYVHFKEKNWKIFPAIGCNAQLDHSLEFGHAMKERILHADQICTSIPSDIIEGIKSCCDGWDCLAIC